SAACGRLQFSGRAGRHRGPGDTADRGRGNVRLVLAGHAQRIARTASREGVIVMEVLVFLVPLAITLGALGLAAFLWSLRNGQYDDLDGAAWRAIMDDEGEASSNG